LNFTLSNFTWTFLPGFSLLNSAHLKQKCCLFLKISSFLSVSQELLFLLVIITILWS
jgi:hypothetical protein